MFVELRERESERDMETRKVLFIWVIEDRQESNAVRLIHWGMKRWFARRQKKCLVVRGQQKIN